MSETVFIATDANGFKYVVTISDELLPSKSLPDFQERVSEIIKNVIGSTPIYIEKASAIFNVDAVTVDFKMHDVRYCSTGKDPIGLTLSRVLGHH